MRAPRRARSGLWDAVFSSLLLAAAGYWTYRYAEYRLRERREERYPRSERSGLTPEQLVQLGWTHAPPNVPDSSYLRKAARKAAGTTRLGLFGCSFVHGMEVGPKFDLGSALERRFRRAGVRGVEVVNFGTFGYGMHQSCLLWSCLGRRYGLDRAIFFPEEFHFDRDESFQFYEETQSVHARYALAGDGVELVRLEGRDAAEAAERYHSLWTPWRYARFDRRPPLALRIVVPERKRRGLNPFYYRRGPVREELLETYARLFASIEAQGGRPMVWTHSREIADVLGAHPRLRGVPVRYSGVWEELKKTPEIYYAPGTHLGPLGNDVQAGELQAYLSGAARYEAPLIELSPLGSSSARARPEPPLSDYDELAVAIGPHRLSVLAVPDPVRPHRSVPIAALRDPKAAALVATAPPDASLLPATALLDDGAPVIALLESDGGTVRVPLGRLRAPARAIGSVILERRQWEGTWPRGGRWTYRVEADDWYRGSAVSGARRVARATIEIGETALAGGASGDRGRLLFQPVAGKPLRIRASREGYVALDVLPRRGTLDLVARTRGRREERFPLFSYVIRRRALAVFPARGSR